MIQYKHILITLALLLTAVTGAWADETPLVTITFGYSGPVYSESGIVTVTGSNADPDYNGGKYSWSPTGTSSLMSVTVEPAAGYNITKVVFWSNDNGNYANALEDTAEPYVCYSKFSSGGKSLSDDLSNIVDGYNIAKIEVYGTAAPTEPTIEVTPVAGKTNEWTFTQPGSDVVLTPQYAPAAQLDKDGAPAAVSGLEIAADAAIITAGQSAQGTLLYAVTTSAEAPALTAFSATLPNAKDQNAAGTYYVWYYIQGHDTPQGQEPSADNTFNDSEIMGPVKVELLTNEHTLNIKQSPNITVTVAGTAKTPTDDKVTPVTTGQEVKIKANEGYKLRKVEVKKGAAAKTITIGDVELTYADGDTWETIVSKNSDKIKRIAGGYIVQVAQPAPNQYKYLKVVLSTNKVNPSDIIDPSKNYEWGTIEVYF